MRYPSVPSEDLALEQGGQRLTDPYRFLEDERDPRTVAFCREQAELARSYLGALPGRDRLRDELRKLACVDAVSTPARYGGRYFYSRSRAESEKAILCMREVATAENPTPDERVLIDPNRWPLESHLSLGVTQPSPDGKLLAYALHKNGEDEATLHVLEVDSGRTLELDVIAGAKYAYPSFTPDGDGFYYTFLPEEERTADGVRTLAAPERPAHAEVRYHRIGTDPTSDPLVFGKTGSRERFLVPELSRDGRVLVLYIHHGWSSTDVYLCPVAHRRGVAVDCFSPLAGDVEACKACFQPLCLGRGARFQVLLHGPLIFLITDDGAPHGRVLWAPLSEVLGHGPLDETLFPFRQLIAEDPSAVIEDVRVVGGKLVVHVLSRAQSQLRVYEPSGELLDAPVLPGIGSLSAISGIPEESELFVSYSSFTTPPTVLRGEVDKKAPLSRWAAVEPPSEFDLAALRTEQVLYRSRDGTEISMFLVYRRDLDRDGNAPALLSGYGGFNISLRPEWTPFVIPLLMRGGVLAVPNLRGGGEYGEAWHQAGMGEHKQNVFDDFLAAADYLCANAYTRPERLAIRGGSNGGLLVTAALVQRPTQFRAVLSAVPLCDMLRYHLYGSGPTWIPEYGSPDDEDDARVLAAYSPYHHVEARPYPAVLFLSADHDDRVDPMHARKMAARLQAFSTSQRPVLLRIEQSAGHGGPDHRSAAVEQAADAYAFLCAELEVPV